MLHGCNSRRLSLLLASFYEEDQLSPLEDPILLKNQRYVVVPGYMCRRKKRVATAVGNFRRKHLTMESLRTSQGLILVSLPLLRIRLLVST